MPRSTKKLTFQEFINRANKKFNNKFDYSKAEYKNTSTKIVIICPIHGEFLQTPTNHLTTVYGCLSCSVIEVHKKLKINENDIINDCNKKYKNMFDYSRVVYKNIDTKVEIYCKKHKNWFKQSFYEHIKGPGCRECVKEKIAQSNLLNKDEFIKRSIAAHGDKFDYSKVVYNGQNKKVIIICPIHGEFSQTPASHYISKNPCYKCAGIIKTKEDFIKEGDKIHKNRYNYDEVDYMTATTKVKIFCKECESYFFQEPNNHISGKQGCPNCKISQGEYIIKKFLTNNNIKFIKEKRFKDCKYKNPLPFDFYLPKYNICIEYDGEQHFKPMSIWGKEREFEKIKLNDKIKNNYCYVNKIKLIRIPYFEKDNIEKILNNELKL